MNLKLLKLLQNNDAPLIITVEEKGNQATITRDGVSIEEQYQSLKRIREALAFYQKKCGSTTKRWNAPSGPV